MMNRPDEERGSVLPTAMSFLSLYRDPLVAKNVARSDFKVSDLMNCRCDAHHTLSCGARRGQGPHEALDAAHRQPARARALAPGNHLYRRPPQAAAQAPAALDARRVSLYGKLEVFQEALAYIAGYGIKAYLIMQDMSQLWGAYGKDESILSNCHVRIAYAPNRVETAEWLSRMAGTATIVTEHITESGKRFGAMLTQVSKSYHQISRPLSTADEIMRLRSPQKNASDLIVEPGGMLIFVAGHAPISARKASTSSMPCSGSARSFPCLRPIASTKARRTLSKCPPALKDRAPQALPPG